MLTRLVILLFVVAVLNTGCQKEEKQALFEYPSVAEVKEGMYTVSNDSDAMVLSKTEYLTDGNGSLVIDPNYYKTATTASGDVIYYETPTDFANKNLTMTYPQKGIARIVGIPNEKIKIKKGQIFINNKKIQTFYGKALSAGLYEKEFLEMIKEAPASECSKDCINSVKETFELDLSEFLIPPNTVFIIGDNWSRSLDSRHFGCLPLENILGKVMGYEKS